MYVWIIALLNVAFGDERVPAERGKFLAALNQLTTANLAIFEIVISPKLCPSHPGGQSQSHSRTSGLMKAGTRDAFWWTALRPLATAAPDGARRNWAAVSFAPANNIIVWHQPYLTSLHT